MGGWWIRSALNTGIQNTAAAWTSHLGRAKGVAMTHFLDEEASRDRLGLSRGGGHNLYSNCRIEANFIPFFNSFLVIIKLVANLSFGVWVSRV